MREPGVDKTHCVDEHTMRQLAKQGYSKLELARFFDVTVTTIHKKLYEYHIKEPVAKATNAKEKPRKKEEEKMPDPKQPKCNECKKRAVAGGAAQSGESARKLGLCQRCWGIAGTAAKWRELLGMKTRRPRPSKGGGDRNDLSDALDSLHHAAVQQNVKIDEAKESLRQIRSAIQVLEGLISAQKTKA